MDYVIPIEATTSFETGYQVRTLSKVNIKAIFIAIFIEILKSDLIRFTFISLKSFDLLCLTGLKLPSNCEV